MIRWHHICKKSWIWGLHITRDAPLHSVSYFYVYVFSNRYIDHQNKQKKTTTPQNIRQKPSPPKKKVVDGNIRKKNSPSLGIGLNHQIIRWSEVANWPKINGTRSFQTCQTTDGEQSPKARDVWKKGGVWLPSWELTYPIKSHFWRWFSFSPGGICLISWRVSQW